MLRCVMIGVVILAADASGQADSNWPQWRGPAMDGSSSDKQVPLEWGLKTHIKWTASLPSWGGATPIVWGNSVFVISPSAPQEGADISVARRFPRGGRGEPGGPDLLLMCFHAKTGALQWQRTLATGNALFGKQNLASPSPVTDGRLVWAMTGTGVLSAFEMKGEPRWKRNLSEEYGEIRPSWGYASSPLLHDGKLILEVLHVAGPSYVVAIDGATGKNVWKQARVTDADRECPDAYTTPVVGIHNGRHELIVLGANWVTAHDPTTGTELWRGGGLNPDNRGNYRICASPVVNSGMVFAPTRVRPLSAFRMGGQGDVTSSHVAWRYKKAGPDVPTPVCDGKQLYLVNDNGVVRSLDAATGKVVWGPKRTVPGVVSSSPVLVDGRIYFINEDAVTVVIAAGPEFKMLATNELDGSYTISSLAVASGHLFARTNHTLYCIGK
jgi:outer membrane protein assembly factor BamB